MFQGQTFQPGTIFGENKVGGRLVEQGGMLRNEPPQIRTRGPENLASQGQFGSPSINEQMDSPEYQGLLKRHEQSRGQDKDALGQLEAYGSRFEEQQQQQFGGLLSQGSSPNSYNNNFGPYIGNAGGFGSKGGQARQMGYAPMRQGLGGFF